MGRIPCCGGPESSSFYYLIGFKPIWCVKPNARRLTHLGCDHAHSFTHQKGLSYQIFELEDSGLPQQGILPITARKTITMTIHRCFKKDSPHCAKVWIMSWNLFQNVHIVVAVNSKQRIDGPLLNLQAGYLGVMVCQLLEAALAGRPLLCRIPHRGRMVRISCQSTKSRRGRLQAHQGQRYNKCTLHSIRGHGRGFPLIFPTQ